jgi:hypothetical protein
MSLTALGAPVRFSAKTTKHTEALDHEPVIDEFFP